MANPLAVGQFLRGAVVCQNNEQTSFTTFWYSVNAVNPPAPEDEDFALALDAIMAPKFKAVMPAASSYLGVLGQIVWPLPVRVAQKITASAGAGTAGGNVIPRQCSGLVSWRTNLAGRSQRGRDYIPFPSTTFLTAGGHATGPYGTALDSIAFGAISLVTILPGGVGPGSATISLGVYHRKTHTLTPVQTWTSHLNWATTRRRGDFGRPNSSPF